MRFSIIIPAYNASHCIGKAIESIQQQVFKDYEIIVVCDSCTDNTAEVAKSYGVTVLTANVRNCGLAKNPGLDIAKGQYVMFLDADDWWLHEYVLTEIDKKLEKENRPDVLMYAIIWRGIGYVPAISPTGMMFTHVINKVWKRSFIRDYRFPTGIRISDAAFNDFMLQTKDPRIVNWEFPVYYYNFLCEGSNSLLLGRTVEGTKAYWGLK